MMSNDMKGMIELGWFDDPSLLEALCKANGQQGGTIHQFFGYQDWTDFLDAFEDFRRMGIEFPSKESFNQLAKQYHLTINWDGQ
jgi:hypothetical protein